MVTRALVLAAYLWCASLQPTDWQSGTCWLPTQDQQVEMVGSRAYVCMAVNTWTPTDPNVIVVRPQ